MALYMTQNDIVNQNVDEVIGWQRQIHQNPELGFNERETSEFVAQKLNEFGLEVHTNVSATAVVGALKSGPSDRKVIFRAELDALPIQENTGLAHSSKPPRSSQTSRRNAKLRWNYLFCIPAS